VGRGVRIAGLVFVCMASAVTAPMPAGGLARGRPAGRGVARMVERANLSSDEEQANGASNYPAHVSDDGRYVVFHSDATNLVPEDDDPGLDIYVRDRRTGTTRLVSASARPEAGGDPGDGSSIVPQISGDGRFVAFVSDATDLTAAGDTNGVRDAFVRDLRTGRTERVSVSSDEAPGDAPTEGVAISADGRYVVFNSYADLDPGPGGPVIGPTGGFVYVRDRRRGTTELASVAGDGSLPDAGAALDLAISADGRYVGFSSAATNLVPVDANGPGYSVFVHDRRTGTTEIVSDDTEAARRGADAFYPSLSGDGRYVAFSTDSVTGLAGQVYLVDRRTATTRALTRTRGGPPAYEFSSTPDVSTDGRWVTWWGTASDLVAGDTNGVADVFLHDTRRGTTERASVDGRGRQVTGGSFSPSVSRHGEVVVFDSDAPDLVPGDTNGLSDVFVSARRHRP
jgi:Tol biopolymer transport system component